MVRRQPRLVFIHMNEVASTRWVVTYVLLTSVVLCEPPRRSAQDHHIHREARMGAYRSGMRAVGMNAKLKRMLADAMRDNVALKDLLGKKW